MTRNQLHGKTFEDWIKACGRFPGSADAGRSPTAGFDIEPRFDRKMELPTSIKTTGNNIVGLSDARAFWAIDHDIRMIVGSYKQNPDRKTFATIHEFILSAEILLKLRGDISVAEVEALHQGISMANFPAGGHVGARIWAREQNACLKLRAGQVVLNPKIDSKRQRRVQCSIALIALIDVSIEGESYVCHRERMGDVALPYEQFSTRREFG